MTRTAIETSPTGTVFDYADLKPEMVHVEDIARSLSETSRFGGHVSRTYSVASHAVLVYRIVRQVAGPELAFAALHHDSHEAYAVDIPTPLAYRFGNALVELKAELDKIIGAKLGIAPSLFHHEIVKAADDQALWIEAAVLKESRGIGEHWGHARTVPYSATPGMVVISDPREAEGRFLDTHRRASDELLAWRLAA